jgi:methionyl-tRNA formyltransferase
MRILFLCNRDLASNLALNLLLPAFANHEVRVCLTESVGAIDRAEPAGRRELRAAEQTYPNEVLFPLIEGAKFADDGARHLTFGEVERLRGIPVEVLARPNDPPALAQARAYAPDLVVSVRYGAILRPDFLSIPRLGVLNLHSGLLPAYRGVLASFRALMNGDDEIGCTLHRISDATIDTGAVLATARLRVVPERSLLGSILALYPLGCALIADAIAQLERGSALPGTRQPAGAGNYYGYPTADDWAQFTARGLQVSLPAEMLVAYRRYFPSAGPTSAMAATAATAATSR